MLAHWFISDSLLLANKANWDGMHANAISLLRQCVEGISVIELGTMRASRRGIFAFKMGK